MKEIPDYTPLEKLIVRRPVERIDFLRRQVEGMRVLDLGALDETAVNKIDTPFWLHSQMASVASLVLGVDMARMLPEVGLETSRNSKIIRGNVYDSASLVEDNAIDVIVAGEIIEHLENTSLFLQNLKAEPAMQGKLLLISTPNSTSFYNFILGVFGRESCHRDHLQIYSYKTLTRLFLNANFQDWQLIPYYSMFTEMTIRHSGVKATLVRFSEKLCNSVEFLFPMLAGGWIAVVTV